MLQGVFQLNELLIRKIVFDQYVNIMKYFTTGKRADFIP